MIQKWIKLHSIIKSKPGKATQKLIPVRLEKVKVKMLLKKELDRRISYAVQRRYKELEFGQLMEAPVCGRGSVFSRPNGWEWHPHRDIHYCAGQPELRFNTQQQTSNALTRAWDLKSSLNTDAYIRDNSTKTGNCLYLGCATCFTGETCICNQAIHTFIQIHLIKELRCNFSIFFQPHYNQSEALRGTGLHLIHFPAGLTSV